MHTKSSAHHGFTLIELLIVVAIIAILAAIAVPNFLEAQTRSKISRVKADQRSIATAIESYQVDYNRYPPDDEDLQILGDAGTITPMLPLVRRWYRVVALTSPIAYITAIPEDPFTPSRESLPNPNWTLDEERKMIQYETMSDFKVNSGAYGTNLTDAINKGYRWALFSYGPIRKFGDLPQTLAAGPGIPEDHPYWTQGYENGDAYDPSNGTVSPGYIARTNAGVFGQ